MSVGLSGDLRAELVIGFIEEALVLTKGRWAGQPFRLEPWQREVIREIYGTLDADGRRRYREALIGIARKNGKSTLAGALALYHLCFDGEPAAEVYSLAASKDQARIVFHEARALAEASPVLRHLLKIWRNAIEHPASGSIYRVLSSEDRLAHGYNPSFAIVDELHAHQSPDLYHAMRTALGAREEPLMLSITTAGWDRTSILWQRYRHGEEGKDPSFYFRWFGAPQGCDIYDWGAWCAANPSSWRQTHAAQADALRSIGADDEAAFRRLHLNQWTSAQTRGWLPEGAWEACAAKPKIPRGAEITLGLDASLRRDTSALVWCHRDARGTYHVRQRTWRRDEELGMVDLQAIKHEILDAHRSFAVRWCAYDPFGFGALAQELAELGVPMLEWPQSSRRMVPATQALYDAVLSRRIRHGGDEVLAAHARHAVVRETEYGPRLDKRRSGEPMDAMVALALAVAAWELPEEQRVEPALWV
jgi:phage terminase large subunit-like protein